MSTYHSQGSAASILADRIAGAHCDLDSREEIDSALTELDDLEELDLADAYQLAAGGFVAACAACGTTLYSGRCHNLGACTVADAGATRSSRTGGASSAYRPAAWTISGNVD